MRKTLIVLLAVGLTGLMITPAPAPTCGGGQCQSKTAMAIPTPPPIGKCDADPALRQQCTAAWDKCISVRHRGPVCQREWRKCCAGPTHHP